MQLVDVLDARREVAGMAVHEGLEVGGRIGSAGVLLEQLVEVAHHLADTGEVLGRHPLDPLLEPLEVALEHLLAKLVGEGRECVAASGSMNS